MAPVLYQTESRSKGSRSEEVAGDRPRVDQDQQEEQRGEHSVADNEFEPLRLVVVVEVERVDENPYRPENGDQPTDPAVRRGPGSQPPAPGSARRPRPTARCPRMLTVGGPAAAPARRRVDGVRLETLEGLVSKCELMRADRTIEESGPAAGFRVTKQVGDT